MITVAEAETQLTKIADDLETVFNNCADARDAAEPGPKRARFRGLAMRAEKAMKHLGKAGV